MKCIIEDKYKYLENLRIQVGGDFLVNKKKILVIIGEFIFPTTNYF